MKRFIILSLILACTMATKAQDVEGVFKGHFYNDEYQVYLHINLYDNNVEVPNHELFGTLPGYLGKQRNSFFWLVTASKIKSKHKAELSLINDYGSEDLTATLTQKNDSTFILRQEEGSPLKVANNGKWQKLPKELVLRVKK